MAHRLDFHEPTQTTDLVEVDSDIFLQVDPTYLLDRNLNPDSSSQGLLHRDRIGDPEHQHITSLRRTLGRTLFQRQVPVEKIAELLGHEDTRTKMRYLGINDDDKLAAMRVIDEVFG